MKNKKMILVITILSLFLIPIAAFAAAGDPTLNSPGNKTVNEGATLSFTINASGGSTPYTYSFTSSPAATGAELNASTGAFSWTPGYTQHGSYSVTFKVTTSSGKYNSKTITITVSNVNGAPVLSAIGSKTVAENAALTFTLSATDPDGGTLTYSATGLPTGATLNASTGAFSWTPSYTQANTYNVTFTASDGTLSSSQAITITVTNVNRAPVLSAIGSKSVNEGATLTFTISATDADGDTLTYSAGNLPTGATFNPATKTFNWTPGYDQSGSYPNVLFTVTDNGDPLMSDYEDITISVGNVNRPPVLTPIGSRTVNEGATLTFTITGTDPDGDALTYSASNLPSGAAFDPDTQTFSWTPGYDQAGNYTNVRFTVTDNGDPLMSDYEDITIAVSNVNRPPVLNPIGNKNIEEGKCLQFTITGTDQDGDSLAYSASNLPDGATFDPDTQTFIWTPVYNQSGNYPNVQFTVTDNGDPQASDSEAITITVGNVNRPPVLTPIGSQNIKAGQLLQFTITGTDPDGDSLVYAASNLPDGATFDPDTQTFIWTPGHDKSGDYPNVRFTAADNGDPQESASEEISITVDAVESTTTTTIPSTTTTSEPPLVIELSGFSAFPGDKKVTVMWETATEIDNAGFNILRAESENGEYVQINKSLIPAKGSSTQGASYQIVDEGLQNRRTYFYKLEDIDLNGNSTMHGPVSATPRLIFGMGK